MEDDNSCTPTNNDKDPKQKTDGTASKKESPVSLATQIPHENIRYLQLTSKAQNAIVGMLSKNLPFTKVLVHKTAHRLRRLHTKMARLFQIETLLMGSRHCI